jgi:hypothetical protein
MAEPPDGNRGPQRTSSCRTRQATLARVSAALRLADRAEPTAVPVVHAALKAAITWHAEHQVDADAGLDNGAHQR